MTRPRFAHGARGGAGHRPALPQRLLELHRIRRRVHAEAVRLAKSWRDMAGADYVKDVSCKVPFIWRADDAWLAANPCLKHLGLYAYHADLLEKFAALPPGRYEQIEKLEQLRALENGFDIMVGETSDPGIGMDTPQDAVKFEQLLG